MYDTIVVGTDGSETAAVAVRRAAGLAGRLGAALVVVSAYQPVSEERLRRQRQETPDEFSWMVNPQEEVNEILTEAQRLCAAEGAGDVRTRAVDDAPADALLDVAAQVGADLIVVGSVGMSGARRFLIGSVPNRVAHHAPCDVIIVRTTG
ncbi:MAG TPA: universal stress protein [Acidimicrobiales bacterium]|nr:universal stress protein [Acidimicrobiales bacterium]